MIAIKKKATQITALDSKEFHCCFIESNNRISRQYSVCKKAVLFLIDRGVMTCTE